MGEVDRRLDELHETIAQDETKLLRWARASYNLERADAGNTPRYVLELDEAHSRAKEGLPSMISLGAFTPQEGHHAFAFYENDISYPVDKVLELGQRLLTFITRLETPPPDTFQRKKWEEEVLAESERYGAAVVIYGLNKIKLTDVKGERIVPEDMIMYRSNDAAAREVIRRLAGE